MGALTSEVGYTSATTRRGDHVVYMDMWWGKRRVNCRFQKIEVQLNEVIHLPKSGFIKTYSVT
jgi:hypothetical protein